MSLVVLGLSHHGAPLGLLESVALDGPAATDLESAVLRSEHITEAVVLSTCNRTEVIAESLTFHGALVDITNALAQACSVDRADLQPHLYVHYEDRGIAHAFTVAAGLDSMAVGEAQILGQVRRSLSRAQKHGHVGPAVNGLLQQALRVAKRVHSETEIDLVSGSLVQAGITRAEAALGGLGALSVLVVGAGGMGALAATTVARHGAREVVVLNRNPDRAVGVAERVGGTARPLAELTEALAQADVVIASTGARGQVVTAEHVSAALAARGGRPQVYIDLALPHDVELDVDLLDGATRVGLAELGEDLAEAGSAPQVTVARELVTAEVATYLVQRSAQAVAPTVTALRARAGEVVDAELTRLERRTPGLDEHERAEVRRAVERVVDKLLHTPTVRVKELARDGQGGSYARALSELFDLDPRDVSLVSAPPAIPGEGV
ncbi:glutamyl-tRNA reductase [Arthrobacter sp. NEB 688]|uniref:glutamyl-tRNA reductase n=1 Tax=Arthrobacter sp. NEB 688 TaxID=904039 RepID=UPI00156746E6|nr:glutamyl-tRNA reductase [Arthrobacter sp. NEB 688]QKE83699.1 glutamyl-tRNA reductase [Arthrobacter sp. NEB 688]